MFKREFGTDGVRLLILIGFALGLTTATAHADDKALIAKVKTTWRAQDGETAEQIIDKASKVAHFVPREWEVGQKSDVGEPVFLSWAKHRADKPDDEYTITWDVAPDGAITLGSPYAKTMELGWQAFALSLIASEVTDEDKGANLRFLHDVSNLNFVTTAQGKLGDLLKRGRCTLGDPVTVDYVPKVDEKQPDKGDFWLVELSVNCNVAGPKYFTRDGVVTFKKHGGDGWEPLSFFAHRIATYSPGSWFDRVNPKEQETWEIARKVFERNSLPTSPSPFPK
jgi:hypothetical protein